MKRKQTPRLVDENGDTLLPASVAAQRLGCTDVHLRSICKIGSMQSAVYSLKPLLFREAALRPAWSARRRRGRPARGAKNAIETGASLDVMSANLA